MVRRLLQAGTGLAYFLYSCMHLSGTPSESPASTCLKLFPMAPPFPWVIGTPSVHQPSLQRALEEAAGRQADSQLDGGGLLFPGAWLAAVVPGFVQDGDGLE